MKREKKFKINISEEVVTRKVNKVNDPVVETFSEEVELVLIKVRKKQPDPNRLKNESKDKQGVLISRLNNPIYLSYGNTSLLIPPRGKLKDINPDKLPSLPKGIEFKLI